MILWVDNNLGILFLQGGGSEGPWLQDSLWERNLRDEEEIMSFLSSVLDFL